MNNRRGLPGWSLRFNVALLVLARSAFNTRPQASTWLAL